MSEGDILILKGGEVDSLLAGHEAEVVRVVRAAYEAHAGGDSSLPHSTFLRFPADERSRIIALPAYLGEEFRVAGVKWVSSFPANVEKGLERASAVVILNSTETGQPLAILEGSLISAKRTAASAALAAQQLHDGRGPSRVGVVGCGPINFEIVRFLLAVGQGAEGFTLFDLDPERARAFAEKCRATFPGIGVDVAPDLAALLEESPLVSFATTALRPHVADPSAFRPGATVLHVSLRDLAPEVILACDNVADDVDHVCRAQTSVHLAEQLTGRRDFVRCTLADILLGRAPARTDDASVAVFSPFGLGVLDLAVGKFVLERALQQRRGLVVDSFLPPPWTLRG